LTGRKAEFTGCAYGWGDLLPYTGSCDCPTCEGSGIEPRRTTLPHQLFGDPDCCGCLNGMIWEDHAEIICNECDIVIRRVPVDSLQPALDDLELSLDVTTTKCPHCGAVNLFPGFTRMLAFVCQQCGNGVAPWRVRIERLTALVDCPLSILSVVGRRDRSETTFGVNLPERPFDAVAAEECMPSKFKIHAVPGALLVILLRS
jgi:hypothetical protein